jgi:dipeptidyl aminopeptidase/acylaminoacyl peptidase
MPKHTIIVAFLLFLTIQGLSQQADKGYPVKEYLGQTRITQTSISPDGKYVVAVTVQDNFDTNQEEYSLWRITLEKGDVKEQIKLWNNKKTVSRLNWSENSEYLFFISQDGDGTNLFKVKMNGGSPMPCLSKSIATSLQSYSLFEKDNLILITTNSPGEKKDAYPNLKRLSVQNQVTSTFYKFNFLSEKTDSLFTLNNSVSSMVIAEDKKTMAVITIPEINYYRTKDLNSYTFVLVDLATRSVTKTLANIEPTSLLYWVGNKIFATQFFSKNKTGQYIPAQAKLVCFSADDLIPKNILPGFHGRVDIASLLPDNKILAVGSRSTSSEFYMAEVQAHKKLETPKGEISNVSVARKSSGVVFCLIKKDQFPEVYFAPDLSNLATPRKLTSFNENLNKYVTPEVETISWKNSEGRTIEGVLIWPPGKKRTKNLPFITDIHGGPYSLRYETITTSDLQYYYYGSLLASRGYLVLQPNYTGGVGRGDEFMNAIHGFAISKPVDDILTGIDYIVSQGWIDTSRMATMGASYGGTLTNALITKTHRFKLALPSAGIWDEISSFGVNDGSSLIEYLQLYQWPWENFERYWKESSISGAGNIKTPTLITHGEKDVRVPTSQSYAMYYALDAVGVPVELIIFPEEGHLYRKPSNKLAKVTIELEWIEKYLKKATGMN